MKMITSVKQHQQNPTPVEDEQDTIPTRKNGYFPIKECKVDRRIQTSPGCRLCDKISNNRLTK